MTQYYKYWSLLSTVAQTAKYRDKAIKFNYSNRTNKGKEQIKIAVCYIFLMIIDQQTWLITWLHMGAEGLALQSTAFLD